MFRSRSIRIAAVLPVLALWAAINTGCRPESDSKRIEQAVAPTDTPSGFWSRPPGTHIRVLVYNVHWDAIFDPNDAQNHSWKKYNKRAEFDRVLRATDPDIVCLQEINEVRDPQQLADILDEVRPISGGAKWKAHMGSDNVIVSKFPLTETSIDTIPATRRRHAAALIDLPDDRFRKDAYIINAHYKASGGDRNIRRRQRHSDAIIKWLRDARTPGDQIDLPQGTPMFVLGDLNVYETDPHYHLTTLITGDIVNENVFGPDSKPDWDGTPMTDLLPVHNGAGTVNWTWRDDTQEFNPGDLDHVVYTDSCVKIVKSFVLNTTTMSAEELEESGLQPADVVLDMSSGEFDHLPIVFDFCPAR